MKKSNSFQKQRERILKRWLEEDYPGGTPRFQLSLLTKDLAIFGLIPICAVIIFKTVENSVTAPAKQVIVPRVQGKIDPNQKHSQIIRFQQPGKAGGLPFAKRAPGTLIKVRLMNVVETFSTAPVHAQIIDSALGSEFVGGTLIGNATPEGNTGRVTIDFKYVRPPRRLDFAVPIAARAMSLDGSFGLVAKKKEGVFARAATRSGAGATGSLDNGNQDFKTVIARAFASGLMQELQTDASVAYNNAQLLTLNPMTEFFIELTDYFPGQK